MLSEMDRAACKTFNWSDEKIFRLECGSKNQNIRGYARSSRNLSVCGIGQFRTNKPVCVMVPAAVTSEEIKSPLVFIDEAMQINRNFYLFKLQEKFFIYSQKLLRTITSSHRAVPQLTHHSDSEVLQ